LGGAKVPILQQRRRFENGERGGPSRGTLPQRGKKKNQRKPRKAEYPKKDPQRTGNSKGEHDRLKKRNTAKPFNPPQESAQENKKDRPNAGKPVAKWPTAQSERSTRGQVEKSGGGTEGRKAGK